jgi:hypothetical protein
MISKQIQQRSTVVDRQLMHLPIHDEVHSLFPSQIHATSTRKQRSGCRIGQRGHFFVRNGATAGFSLRPPTLCRGLADQAAMGCV